MKTNEKKIWRKLYMKLSEIEGFKGGDTFFLICENKWKKKSLQSFSWKKAWNWREFFFSICEIQWKKFWQEIQIFLGIVSFSFVFFCVKQSEKNGFGRRTQFFQDFFFLLWK